MREEPLYLGLTRPSMLFGVPASMAIFSLVIVLGIWFNTEEEAVLLLILPLHGAAWMMCREDERIFDLAMAWLDAELRGGRTRGHFRARSYGP
ncbi:MAG: VirB3 family type IV secretion system protein [Chloroflexota bacterium]|nr:VirB3 family type IV secretion system protein [Chloroflexota bacterium]